MIAELGHPGDRLPLFSFDLVPPARNSQPLRTNVLFNQLVSLHLQLLLEAFGLVARIQQLDCFLLPMGCFCHQRRPVKTSVVSGRSGMPPAEELKHIRTSGDQVILHFVEQELDKFPYLHEHFPSVKKPRKDLFPIALILDPSHRSGQQFRTSIVCPISRIFNFFLSIGFIYHKDFEILKANLLIIDIFDNRSNFIHFLTAKDFFILSFPDPKGLSLLP